MSRKNGYNNSHITFDDVCGGSCYMKEVVTTAKHYSKFDKPLLITGETGTGKSILAEAIHNHSNYDKPFVKTVIPAIPTSLIESELFGYKKGAFTGADKETPGKFQRADTGSILLDEIGDLDLQMQVKILGIIENGYVEMLGGGQPQDIKVRLMAATNQDIQKLLEEKKFRSDLYYRLKGLSIHLKPLRERIEDIDELTYLFLDIENTSSPGITCSYGDGVIDSLKEYEWPGNIRQLKNCVEAMAVNVKMKPGCGIINKENVDNALRKEKKRASSGNPGHYSTVGELSRDMFKVEEGMEVSLKDIGKIAKLKAEKAVIKQVLAQEDWNRSKTNKRIGISYKTLLYKIKDFGLARPHK
ncbi:sigma 54-interacting transcriptional regulator [Candidatus Pacearchaeota archaeon]|nr:sigma 54-interacting transcriptional regulator [Candidatus Pacearchaeota archaeon]